MLRAHRGPFAFIKHTSRSLPIRLYAACKGRVCDATQTCNQSGTCESAVVSDDTGCLPSEPNCNGIVPVTAPVDAGDSDDAAAVDASDAAPPEPCTAANGTHAITTGSASDRMAVNSTQLIWIGTGIVSDTTVPLMTVDSQSPGPPRLLYTFVPPAGDSVTGFAVDDRAVWLGTETKAYRYDLHTQALMTYDTVTSTMAIASSTARDAAGPIVTTKAFAVTAANAAGGNGAATGAIYELREDGSHSVHPIAGTRIAAANRSVPTLFVFTPMLYKGPKIYRGLPTSIDFETIVPVDDSLLDMATDDDSVFFSTGKALHRVDATATMPTLMFDVTQAGRVAVDQTSVFYEQKGTDSAIFRGVKNPLNGGIFPPAPQRVATGYGNVSGLAIDAACVYFWSTPAIGGIATLNVYPKTRTVIPGQPTR